MPPSIPILLGGEGPVFNYMISRLPVTTLRAQMEEDFPIGAELEFRWPDSLSKALCAKLENGGDMRARCPVQLLSHVR